MEKNEIKYGQLWARHSEVVRRVDLGKYRIDFEGLKDAVAEAISYVQKHWHYPSLPENDAVQNWFEENIDKDCSASSAIYKFSQWLEELQVKQQPGPVWIKASTRMPNTYGLITWRWIDKSAAYTGYKEKGGFIFGSGGASVDPTYYSEIEWLDESATPAAEIEEIDPQELWDEHSALIGEDLDDLNYWSGREVMKKEDFLKALQLFKEQKEK